MENIEFKPEENLITNKDVKFDIDLGLQTRSELGLNNKLALKSKGTSASASEEEDQVVNMKETARTISDAGSIATDFLKDWGLGGTAFSQTTDFVMTRTASFFSGLADSVEDLQNAKGFDIVDSLDYDPYDAVILSNDAWLTTDLHTFEKSVPYEVELEEAGIEIIDSISEVENNIQKTLEASFLKTYSQSIKPGNLRYASRTEDVYINKYIQPVYEDVKCFCDAITKMMRSNKLFNNNAFQVLLKANNAKTQIDLEDFRYNEINISSGKKNTYNYRYGPTGGTVAVDQLSRQTNTFNVKVKLSRGLKELLQFADKAGWGFYDANKGWNFGYVFDSEVSSSTLVIQLKSNAWVNRIGQAGYRTDMPKMENISFEKGMPAFTLEKFRIRTIKFPLDFDASNRGKPAELELTCSASRVYPTLPSD